jgi:hypothetical protein
MYNLFKLTIFTVVAIILLLTKKEKNMRKRPKFLTQDRTIISQKVKEAFSSVLPITLIVLLLCVTFTPLDSGLFLSFIVGAFFVILGMGLFTLGADTAI